MAYMLGRPIGAQMLDALGLSSEQCMSLVLTFKPDEIVTAVVEYAADGDITTLVREWRAGIEQGRGG